MLFSAEDLISCTLYNIIKSLDKTKLNKVGQHGVVVVVCWDYTCGHRLDLTGWILIHTATFTAQTEA